MDAAVASWLKQSGVFGARLTGGGFGGCIVALTTPGALAHDPDAWTVLAVDGAAGSRC
jgi:galactokinase